MSGLTLKRLFWIVACCDAAFCLAVAVDTVVNPHGEFAGLEAIFYLGMLIIVGVIAAVVAFTRSPIIHGIALVLLILPPASWVVDYATMYALTPSQEALEAGHGYFKTAPDRALADAIVAGDEKKVAALAPTANLQTIGWDYMTFMHLALEDGHAKPEVVAALLKAGINPEQDNQYLFGSMNDGSESRSGAMITGQNEVLLRAVIATGIDLNHLDQEGNPRFLSAVRWPEGLAILLDHGANVETESSGGKTPIMWAVMLWHWPAIDVLLAHGAKLDHVDRDGTTLKALVEEKVERYRRDKDELPPQLATLVKLLGP